MSPHLDPAQRAAVESTQGRAAELVVAESPAAGLVYSSAVFSPCRLYRYTLWRVWNPELPLFQCVGLNPSTADEAADDPTVALCARRARRAGCGSLAMTNVFAFRATDPRDMKRHAAPIGPENDHYLAAIAAQAAIVMGAWGGHGSHQGRCFAVAAALPGLRCIGVTKGGQPWHPLYKKESLPLVPWEPAP